jgi:tRNA/tmRNA/rRNA uracil-C5-methylase (TrmA/RlmC/RlmD family)
VDYAAQVRAKELILRDAIQRIGKLSLPGEVKMTPSPSPYGYRGRARVLIRDGRVGFRRRRSHALCPTRRCPILVSPLEEALRRLAEAAPGEDGQWELLAGVELAVRSVPVSPEDTTGEKIRVAVGRHRLQISPGVFVQSNVLLLEPLAAAVHEAAGQGQVAVELYAGAGFLTLGLAELFRRVVAVEAQPAAARDLAANCRAAGLTNVRVLNERAEQALAQPDRLPERPDLAVLDPPRSGLGPESVRALARLAPRRIVALSCNPATLARDLADLRSLGYALRHLSGFDVFPQTPHLEALAVLEAQAGGV